MHWVPIQEKEKIYDCEKCMISIQIVKFTKDEYDLHLKVFNPNPNPNRI